jgi:ABC-2 type transport system permease protein
MSNALTMASRSLRLSARSPEALLTALLLPVMLMVVFVYLFGGAVSIGTAYVDYVAPGVLLLCAVTGAATTSVTVCQDMVGGIIDRFRSLDVRGTAVLAGPVTSPPRSACCCSSWPRSPGWPRRSGCWSARPRRPTRPCSS